VLHTAHERETAPFRRHSEVAEGGRRISDSRCFASLSMTNGSFPIARSHSAASNNFAIQKPRLSVRRGLLLSEKPRSCTENTQLSVDPTLTDRYIQVWRWESRRACDFIRDADSSESFAIIHHPSTRRHAGFSPHFGSVCSLKPTAGVRFVSEEAFEENVFHWSFWAADRAVLLGFAFLHCPMRHRHSAES